MLEVKFTIEIGKTKEVTPVQPEEVKKIPVNEPLEPPRFLKFPLLKFIIIFASIAIPLALILTPGSDENNGLAIFLLLVIFLVCLLVFGLLSIFLTLSFLYYFKKKLREIKGS